MSEPTRERAYCVCGASLDRRSFSQSFDALVCNACKSNHFVSRPGQQQQAFDYNNDNQKYSDPAYLQGRQLRWAHRSLLTTDWRQRKVLEVGCFNGFFLSELRTKGAHVFGFDVNERAIQVGEQSFGLRNCLAVDLDQALAFGPFDDILCIDVLEHLDRPEELVQVLCAHLSERGRLVVAGPTIERGFHDKSDFPPHHKWWFSRLAMRMMADKEGLRLESESIQRDGMLLLRNVVGRWLSKGPRNEFYGDGGVVAPDTSKGWIGGLYQMATALGSATLFMTGRSYCSTVMYFRKGSAA